MVGHHGCTIFSIVLKIECALFDLPYSFRQGFAHFQCDDSRVTFFVCSQQLCDILQIRTSLLDAHIAPNLLRFGGFGQAPLYFIGIIGREALQQLVGGGIKRCNHFEVFLTIGLIFSSAAKRFNSSNKNGAIGIP